MQATNWDLENIVTPVKYEQLYELLIQSKYNTAKTSYLVNGFKNGFDLEYQGKLHNCRRMAPNLKLRIGSKLELWNKVMKEVELDRFAGPYKDPPFDYFVQSPIGLVPKDKGLKTRLIFHLSYPWDGDSVNSGIPHSKATVKYPEFDEAVKLCMHEGGDVILGNQTCPVLLGMFHFHPANGGYWS